MSRNCILTKFINDSAWFLLEKLKNHVILIKNFNISLKIHSTFINKNISMIFISSQFVFNEIIFSGEKVLQKKSGRGQGEPVERGGRRGCIHRWIWNRRMGWWRLGGGWGWLVTTHGGGADQNLVHCTMCSLLSFVSSRLNEVRYILKSDNCYTIQHIFVPARSFERKVEKIPCSWVSNSKFVIFPQIFPCSNHRAI